jgi:hypothetical protein
MKTDVTDLPGLIRLALDDFSRKIHTGIPGAITSYTASSKSASVQPTVMKRIWNNGVMKGVPLPVINSVPVQFPGTARAQISFDLKAGDTGMIMFSESALDAWLASGGGSTQVDPQDDRRLDYNDAYFIPGVSPIASPGIPGVASGLLLQYVGSSKTAQVLINNDGTIQLNGNSKHFTLYEPLLSDLQTLVNAIVTALNGIASGSGAPVAAAFNIASAESTTLETGG